MGKGAYIGGSTVINFKRDLKKKKDDPSYSNYQKSKKEEKLNKSIHSYINKFIQIQNKNSKSNLEHESYFLDYLISIGKDIDWFNTFLKNFFSDLVYKNKKHKEKLEIFPINRNYRFVINDKINIEVFKAYKRRHNIKNKNKRIKINKEKTRNTFTKESKLIAKKFKEYNKKKLEMLKKLVVEKKNNKIN